MCVCACMRAWLCACVHPQVMERPPQWDIYREDLAFVTPWVAPLVGLYKYKVMHW